MKKKVFLFEIALICSIFLFTNRVYAVNESNETNLIIPEETHTDVPLNTPTEYNYSLNNNSVSISGKTVPTPGENIVDTTQTISTTLTQTVDKYTITVTGNIPEDAELSVKRVYNTDQLEEVIGDDNYSIYVAFDIEILINGEVWQPVDDGETVTITATNIEIPEGEELKVYRVEDEALGSTSVPEEAVVELNATEAANGDIEVETDHFTVYTVGGVEHDLTPAATGTWLGMTYETFDSDGDDTAETLVLSGTQTISASSDPLTSDFYGKAPYYRNDITTISFQNGTKLISGYYLFDNCNNLIKIDITNADVLNCTDFSYMFSGCSALTSLDLSNFDTSNGTNFRNMFNNCKVLVSIDVSSFNTSNGTDFGCMFNNCQKLTNLDASSFNTSSGTDFDSMFYNCRSLTSLDVSGFNTSNGTNFYDMFRDCSSLTNLDVSSFDTSKGTNFAGMFNYCSSLTSLDVSNFDTKENADFSHMFYGCSGLTSLDVSNFDTLGGKNFRWMFSNCSKLTSLNLSNFDTSNSTDFNSMFAGCSSLTNLDISNFKTTNGKNFSYMFSNCSKLTSLNLSKFDTSNSTNFSGMFNDCKSLASLDISDFNTANATDISYMFSNCKSLTSLDASGFNTLKVTTMESVFLGCSSLTNLDISNFDTSNVTDMDYIFSGCSSLTVLKAPKTIADQTPTLPTKVGFAWYLDDNEDNIADSKTKYTELIHPVADKSHIYVRSDKEGFQKLQTTATLVSGSSFRNSMYQLSGNDMRNITSIVYDENPSDTVKNAAYKTISTPDSEVEIRMCFVDGVIYCYPTSEVDVIYANSDCSNMFGTDYNITRELGNCTNIDLTWFNTANVTSMFNMFGNCKKLTSLDVSGFDTANVTHMFAMFSGCSSLTGLDVSGFKTSNVTNMNYMFNKCSSLTSLNVSGFKTSNVTDMSNMFKNCSSLTGLDISGFDTSNVTNMSFMFQGCSSLTSLNVSGFKTLNVTNMGFMFDSCSSLTSLDVSGFNTLKVTTMDFMFDGCSSLTSLDISGFKTSNVTNMSGMFMNCSKLINLNVSGLNTSNVTDMHCMFNGCSSLTSLDISGLKTPNVTNMSGMFNGCSSLTGLDVSDFDTTKVTDMSGMFSTCSSLTSLDLSKFNTSNVTSMNSMFLSCSSLTNLDVSGFNTTNVTDMGYMFSCCSSLTTLDVSKFNTSNVTDMNNMFSSCSSLASLDVSGFDTKNVTNISGIYSVCSALTEINLSTWVITDKMQWMSRMFFGCFSLRELKLGDFDTQNVLSMYNIFTHCNNLKEINISSWNLSNIGNQEAYGYSINKYASNQSLKNLTSASHLPSIPLNAKRVYAPKTILDSQTIELPSSAGKYWYLDDEAPKLEGDTKTQYTELINGVANESHTYIRSDIDGFSLPKTTAKLVAGEEFNSRIKTLVSGQASSYTDIDLNITQFIHAPYESEHDNAVNVAMDGQEPVYAKPIVEGVIKYSHTGNIDDDGNASGSYSNSLHTIDTVAIPNAERLHVTLKYGTENGWDQVYVFKGTYNGSVSRNMSAGQLAMYQGENNSPKTVEFDVEGDTVSFAFYSDSSGTYWGYHAKVEGLGSEVKEKITGIGIYTEADKILTNEDCSHMFEGFEALETFMLYNLDMSLTTNVTDMFKGDSELKTIASPHTIPAGAAAVLPTKEEYKWYLDDELPMNEVDTKTSYTTWITGTSESHMYVRSDREGFSTEFNAYLIPGAALNDAMAELAGGFDKEIYLEDEDDTCDVNTTIKKVIWTNEDLSTDPEATDVSVNTGRPVYMVFRNGEILANVDADKVHLNADSKGMFARLTELTDYSFITDDKVTFDLVENVSGMFGLCQKIEDVTINKNTPQLINISAMFAYCTSLKKIDISSFDLNHDGPGPNISPTFSIVTGCTNLEQLKAPTGIREDSQIGIYIKEGIKETFDPTSMDAQETGALSDWYLDDDGNYIADSCERYYFLKPDEAQSHTYIRSIIDGFQLPDQEATLSENLRIFHSMPLWKGMEALQLQEIRWSDEYFDDMTIMGAQRVDDGTGAPIYARLSKNPLSSKTVMSPNINEEILQNKDTAPPTYETNLHNKQLVKVEGADFLMISIDGLALGVSTSTSNEDCLGIVPGDFDGNKEELKEKIKSLDMNDYFFDATTRRQPGNIIIPGDTATFLLLTDDVTNNGEYGYMATVTGFSKYYSIELYTDASKVYLNKNCSGMFANCDASWECLESFLHTVDSSKVEDMEGMFAENPQFMSVDLSCMDTPNLKKMDWMFENCTSLQSVDLSNISIHEPNINNTAEDDEPYETDISGMFSGCLNLKEVILPKELNYFGEYMFDFCFNLSSVKGCKDIVEIQPMAFNTSFEQELEDWGNDEIKTIEDLIERYKENYGIDITPYYTTQNRYLFFEDYKDLTADCWHEYDWDADQRTVQVFETAVPAGLNLNLKPENEFEIEISTTVYLQDKPVDISIDSQAIFNPTEQTNAAEQTNTIIYTLLPEEGKETLTLGDYKDTAIENYKDKVRYSLSDTWSENGTKTERYIVTFEPSASNNYLPGTYRSNITVLFSGEKQRAFTG